MDLETQRQKAWTGDAVLSLFAREWILRERGKMDGEQFVRLTSNDFLATIGNPTRVEADIGVIYEKDGLAAAFGWIERELIPRFELQEKKRRRIRS
ncbi:MAG: dsRNA-specific ribonuclease [Verrucomicrobiales bacterium]|jgi:dsRNA-specific ribonuclease